VDDLPRTWRMVSDPACRSTRTFLYAPTKWGGREWLDCAAKLTLSCSGTTQAERPRLGTCRKNALSVRSKIRGVAYALTLKRIPVAIVGDGSLRSPRRACCAQGAADRTNRGPLRTRRNGGYGDVARPASMCVGFRAELSRLGAPAQFRVETNKHSTK